MSRTQKTPPSASSEAPEPLPTLQAEALAARAEWESGNRNGPAYAQLFRRVRDQFERYGRTIYSEYLSLEFHRAVTTYKPGTSFIYYLAIIIRNSHDLANDRLYENRNRALCRGLSPSPASDKRQPKADGWNVVTTGREQEPFIQMARKIHEINRLQSQHTRKAALDPRASTYASRSYFWNFCAGLSEAASSFLSVLTEMSETDGAEWAHLFIDEAKEELSERFSESEIQHAIRELAEFVSPDVDALLNPSDHQPSLT